MMNRGRLEYTGFAMPVDWAVASLAALPVTQELLIVPDLQKDHRFACLGTPPCFTCLSHRPGQWQRCSRQNIGTSGRIPSRGGKIHGCNRQRACCAGSARRAGCRLRASTYLLPSLPQQGCRSEHCEPSLPP